MEKNVKENEYTQRTDKVAKKERTELNDLIESSYIMIEYDKFYVDEERTKYIAFQSFPENEENKPLVKFTNITAWIDSYNYNLRACVQELLSALEITYSEEFEEEFEMVSRTHSVSEYEVYTKLDYAIFRLSILWNILAQVINVEFDLEMAIDKINYKKMIEKNKGLSDLLSEINDYISEIDDTKCVGFWKVNHRYVSEELRNTAAHRYSPFITSMNNQFLNMKHHPSWILKRVSEDLGKNVYFTKKLLNREYRML